MSLKLNDPWFHEKQLYFPLLKDFHKYKDTLQKEIDHSKDISITQFRDKYHNQVPAWIVCEVISLGTFISMFKGFKKDTQSELLKKKDIDIPIKVFNSWLESIRVVRNTCAHHGQLWNRYFHKVKPMLPKGLRYPEWEIPEKIDNKTLFAQLSILHYLIYSFFKNSNLKNELVALLEKYHDAVQPSEIGMPQDWQEYKIWHL